MARRRAQPIAFSLFAFQDIITSVTGIMILITLMLSLEALNAKPVERSNPFLADVLALRQDVEALERDVSTLRDRAFASDVASVGEISGWTADEVAKRVEATETDHARLEACLEEATARLQERKALDREEGADELTEIENLDSRIAADTTESTALGEEIESMELDLARSAAPGRLFFAIDDSDKTTWIVEITSESYRVAPVGRAEVPQEFHSVVDLAAWAQSLDPRMNAFLLLVKPDGIGRHRRVRLLLASGTGGLGYDANIYPVSADAVVLDPEVGAGSR
ncbi:MAG TPA: hypothetical protein VGN57_23175 [Pirellulaceae bacterium]|jgi:hypothetical protein|nr:hypothetical protein [Pirellulaceae bacterium]